jgi:hypothetical protein
MTADPHLGRDSGPADPVTACGRRDSHAGRRGSPRRAASVRRSFRCPAPAHPAPEWGGDPANSPTEFMLAFPEITANVIVVVGFICPPPDQPKGLGRDYHLPSGREPRHKPGDPDPDSVWIIAGHAE